MTMPAIYIALSLAGWKPKRSEGLYVYSNRNRTYSFVFSFLKENKPSFTAFNRRFIFISFFFGGGKKKKKSAPTSKKTCNLLTGMVNKGGLKIKNKKQM